MKSLEITQLNVPRCKLGEGPVWDVDTQTLFYVDAAGGILNRLDPVSGQISSWQYDGRVASLGVIDDDTVIAAMWDGLYRIDLTTGARELLDYPDPNPVTSLNDGKVDPRGRFICGSVHLEVKEPLGKLYSIDVDGTVTTLDEGITVANGPCWSPDGTTMYHADSAIHTIYAYDYDLETGAATNRRVFANTKALGGIPDGTTVDTQGYVWSAICESGTVVRFTPTGDVDRTIQLPTSMVSSVIFGGENLDRLYVTSIDPRTFNLPAEELGGATFVIDGLGIQGLPEPRCRLTALTPQPHA